MCTCTYVCVCACACVRLYAGVRRVMGGMHEVTSKMSEMNVETSIKEVWSGHFKEQDTRLEARQPTPYKTDNIMTL